MVWATHRDWNAAEVANALVRSANARPLGKAAVPNTDWGYGSLDVRAALHEAKLPDPHEPNDWVAAALAQRPLHPGAVVDREPRLRAAITSTPTRSTCRPAATRAPCCAGRARRDAARALDPRQRRRPERRGQGAAPVPRASTLPAGRSLVVVARRQGAGAYTLALSGS